MKRLALVIAAFLGIAANAAEGQNWRTLDATGVRRDSAAVSVNVDYTRGRLAASAGEGDEVLYDFHLRYDATRARPLLSFDSATRVLAVGAQTRSDVRVGGDGRNSGDAVLKLARTTPMDMVVRLDVASGNLELGGMSLRRVSVRSSASEVRLNFDEPNQAEMEALELDVSAASLTASRLANAGAKRIRVGARAAGAELHLTGEWTRDLEIDLDITLGVVAVHVPADVGVQLEARRIFASVEAAGLTRSGDMYVSANWDSAPRKVRIRASATLGQLELIHARR